MAKEWFARAEAAENAGNDVEAVRDYACSMKMVAHAFTAFNLGRVAERSGDLELALKSYKSYLTLKADAPDRDEVQTKIGELETKVKEVKENIGGAEPAATENPPPAEEKPETPVTPPPLERPERPSPIEPPPQVAETGGASHGSSHVLDWVLGGTAVAVFAVAWIPNVMARNDMNTCNADADKVPAQLASARAACDSARPEAYASYVMFGVAGAVAAAEVGWLLYRFFSYNGDSSGSADSSVSLGWIPGGVSLSARGRF